MDNNYLLFISNILSAIATGIYAIIIFIIVSKFIVKPITSQQRFNIFSLIFLLYMFGFIKHQIGYYLTIESNYCKQTSICENLIKHPELTFIERVKSGVGFLGNVWLENVGEGITFVLVGLPAFLLIENKIFAAFLTGIFAQIISEYSGFHAYFCRTSCNVIPLI
jgi:hypothetical protein